MARYPTLQELIDSEKTVFSPYDVAGVLGTHPYAINVMVRDQPEQLGFPAFKIGNRVKIPKIPFLQKMGVTFNGEKSL